MNSQPNPPNNQSDFSLKAHSPTQSSSKTSFQRKNLLILVACLILTGSIAGGSVYLWQASLLRNTQQDMQQQINLLENQVQQLEREIKDQKNDLSDTTQIEKIEQQDLVISSFSTAGMLQAKYLYEDGSFVKIDQLIYDSDQVQCQEGIVDDKDYHDFINFIENQGFFETEITQSNDPALMCSASQFLQIGIGGQSNEIGRPCVPEFTPETKEVLARMENISEELDRLTGIDNQVCKQGIYIKTRSINQNCEDHNESRKESFAPEIDYQTYSLSSVPEFLETSLSVLNAYVYAGPAEENIKSYHRQYFELEEISGSCFFIYLSEFDGKRFLDLN